MMVRFSLASKNNADYTDIYGLNPYFICVIRGLFRYIIERYATLFGRSEINPPGLRHLRFHHHLDDGLEDTVYVYCWSLVSPVELRDWTNDSPCCCSLSLRESMVGQHDRASRQWLFYWLLRLHSPDR